MNAPELRPREPGGDVPLFRKEAQSRAPDAQEGEVRLARPLRWSTILAFLFVATVLCVAIAAVALTPATERVTGRIGPSLGSADSVRGPGESAVRAGSGGRIGRLLVREGDLVTAGDAIAIVVPQGGTITAELAVPERLVGRLRAGLELDLDIDSPPAAELDGVRGKVLAIEGPASNRSYLVRIALIDVSSTARERIAPGMTVTANLNPEDASPFRRATAWLFGG